MRAEGDLTDTIELAGLGHRFGELEVLAGMDLAVAEHEVVGLVGPSGCGKSTLLELVAGLTEPAQGDVRVGDEISGSGRLNRCAYMPQGDVLLPWLSALDNACLAPRNRGEARWRARARAMPMLRRFDLGEFADAMPDELSGGMRQRVAFCRTLLADKQVLLLDEPFASLDAITRAEMQAWLASALGEAPRTTLLVTHDVEEALYLCDRVIVLSERPARGVAELRPKAPRAGDRTATVTAPAFSLLRERALHSLGGGVT